MKCENGSFPLSVISDVSEILFLPPNLDLKGGSGGRLEQTVY